MTPSARQSVTVLGILLVSVAVGTGLLALEAHLAPMPGPENQDCYDDVLDDLEASTFRWQAFYLPVFQLWISVSVGMLIAGRFAWLQNLGASLFALCLVFIHHATTSLASAAIFVPIYLIGGMAIATVVRSKWARTKMTVEDEAISGL